jgi:site-specific DNA recombinase
VAKRGAVIDVLAVVTVYPPGRGTRTFRPETIDIEWRTS